MISQITNYSLIGLFVLICLGLVIAFIRGWKKGIWRTCYRMFFMITLFVLAFCLLQTLTDALAVAPVNFTQYKSIILRNDAGETYYVAITTFQETVTELAKGYYYINHIPYSYDRIVALATSFATTTVKMTAVLLQFLMILIFGNLLCLILWHLVFKKIVPLIAQKLMKVKWLAMLQNGVTYLLVLTLFISPLTTMVNLLNQSYQQNKDIVNKNNQIVQTATSFLDTYNQSIFNNLFSWSADEDGITFDAKLMGWLTESSNDFGTLNLVNEFDNLLDLSMYLTNALGDGMTFAFDSLVNDETVDALFDALGNSELFTMILPAALNIGASLDVVKNTIDLSDIDFEAFDYTGEDSENEAIRNMFKNLIDSGVFDGFFDENGNFTTSIDAKTLIRDTVVDRDKFDKIIAAFNEIDKSQLLSAVIPSVMYMLNDMNPELDKYLPDTWNELANIKWGRELNIVLDSLQRIATIGEDNEILEAILDMLPGDSGATSSKAKLYENSGAESETNPIVDALLNHLDEIRDILCGKSDDSHESDGTTIIEDDDDRLNIFDCELMKWMFTPMIDAITGTLGSAVDDQEKLETDMERSKTKLSTPGSWRNNYRKEFTAIFAVLSELAKYNKIMDVVSNPMDVFSDLGNLDQGLIVALTGGLEKLDESYILRGVLGQIFQKVLTDESILGSVGLDAELIKEGFAYCDDDNVNIMGKELAFLIFNISSIGKLTKIADKPSPIDAIGEEPENKMHIANLLDVLYLSKILNGGADSNGVEGKENYFNALHFLFDKVHSAEESLVFDIDSCKDKNIQWINSRSGEIGQEKYNLDERVLSKGVNDLDPNTGLKYRGENANIAIALYTMSEQNIVGAFSEENISSIKKLSEKSGVIHTILSAAADSYILSGSLGNFLDAKLIGKGLTDDEAKFANVTDWQDEADKLDVILKSVGEFDEDLQNLNLSECTDIVGLNNLLHSLADSNIFFDEEGKYIFSHWMYNKVTSTIGNGIDLFADPKLWDVNLWGEKPDLLNDYYIAQTDFYSLDKKSDWYSEDFSSKFDISKYTVHYDNYYENPDFYFDYFARPKTEDEDSNVTTDGYRCDELGKICEVIYFVSCQKLNLKDINLAETSTFKGIFNALCDTDSMRICIYNSFNQVADTVKTNLINLEEARNEYLIDCNKSTKGISKPEAGSKERHFECEVVSELFDVYKTIGSGSGLSDIFSIDEDTFNAVEKSFTKMADSKVYHQLGPRPSSLITNPNVMTTFQSLMTHLYDNDVLKDGLLYRDSSSKDNYFKLKGCYNDDTSKIDYTVLNFFSYKDLSNIEEQKNEISKALEAAKILQGLPHEEGETTINFSKLVFDKPTLKIIYDFLHCYDQETNTFFDVVPNLFYKLFHTDGQFGAIGSDNFLEDASIEFMYVSDYPGATSSDPEGRFNNRVTDVEIANVMDLLFAFNTLGKDEAKFDNMANLTDNQIDGMKSVFKTASKSYMLHTYNDNIGDSSNLTVYESLVKKVLVETKLSYCSYSADNRGFASDDEKTIYRIKNVTKYDGQTLDVSSLSEADLKSYLTDRKTNKICWTSEASEGENQIDYIFDLVKKCQSLKIGNIADPTAIAKGTQIVGKLRNIYLCKDVESLFII